MSNATRSGKHIVADNDQSSAASHAQTLHGTALAYGDVAVLLVGKPGSGKSDLALRCLAAGQVVLAGPPIAASTPRLLADDAVLARVVKQHIELTCPRTIHGQLEVRGVGIVALPQDCVVQLDHACRLALVVALAAPTEVPRLPEPATRSILGQPIPTLALDPFEPSAPLKVALALATVLK